MTEAFGNIVLILLLVLANGFFVAAEFAIVKVRASQVEEKYRRGHRRAGLTKLIIEHLDEYLSATQLGITLASLGLGWVGEPLLAEMLRMPLITIGITSETVLHTVSVAISFSILTALHIVLGELAPKSLAIRFAEPTSFIIALPLRLFYRVFQPAIWLLNAAANFLLRAVGIPAASTSGLMHSPEELEIIVTEGARSGALNKTEQELITSIFEFTNTTAREVMVPRTNMIALDIETPKEDLIRHVTEEGYSRLPIFHDTIDNIVGIIYTKDLITLLEHRDIIILHDIIRPAFFVPGSIKISKLMRDLQQKKLHMAIVVDEFGGTQGLVTMEDILEEIVGEIHDEYDETLKEVEQSSDGSALVDARIEIKNFNSRFLADIPDDPDYETLNGFLYKLTGKIPDLQEEITFDNLHFTVMKKSPRGIRQVKVRKLSESSVTPSSGDGQVRSSD